MVTKRKQTVLETAARDCNWLVGRLLAAEKQFNAAVRDALEYADTEYRATCMANRLLISQKRYYTFQRALSSVAAFCRARVRDRFALQKTFELLRKPRVEVTQRITSSTFKEPT